MRRPAPEDKLEQSQNVSQLYGRVAVKVRHGPVSRRVQPAIARQLTGATQEEMAESKHDISNVPVAIIVGVE